MSADFHIKKNGEKTFWKVFLFLVYTHFNNHSHLYFIICGNKKVLVSLYLIKLNESAIYLTEK